MKTLSLSEKIELLKYHQELYYNGFVDKSPEWLIDEPPMSDAEYDSLFDEVKKLDPNNPVITGVGASSKGAVKHAIRMGSLAKVKTIDGIKEFHRKYANRSKDIVIMPKIDGLSLTLKYALSTLNEAATRGDGVVGESVFGKAKYVHGCKEKVSSIGKSTEVRGEVVMPLSVFNELNRNGEGLSNPRNAAVGSLKQDDENITKDRNLKFWAYDVFGKYSTQTEKLEALEAEGDYNVPIWYKVEYTGDEEAFWKEVETYIKNFVNNVRPNLDYATDGLVIALDSIQDQDDAGWASNMHHPNGKIAFKFDPEEKETEIIGYHLQVGRTGRIIPVADIKPVIIDGVEVRSPTLHNFGNMIDNGLFPGAKIKVVRANDVIPYIKKEIIKPVFKTFTVYPVCPCCGSVTSFDGVNLWCNNSGCEAKMASKIIHFLKTVECLNVGKETVKKIVESGKVKSLSELVNPNSVSDVAAWIGSSKSNSREAEIVYNALKGIRGLTLEVFIESLGIGNVGKNTSNNLAAKYKNLEGFLEANHQDLLKMQDVGPTTADSIMDAICTRYGEIYDLAKVIGISVKKMASNNLEGKTFLFTGTLSKPRKFFEEKVTMNGGSLVGSVSKNLDYLVVGDEAGSKLTKANALGIKTLTEEEFISMINGK